MNKDQKLSNIAELWKHNVDQPHKYEYWKAQEFYDWLQDHLPQLLGFPAPSGDPWQDVNAAIKKSCSFQPASLLY